MSKTIIYSCGQLVTAKDLESMSPRQGLFYLFPEIGGSDAGVIYPFTDHELVEVAKTMIGHTIITVSEIIILTILREIRIGNLSTSDVELYCNGQRVAISARGEMIDPGLGASLKLDSI